MPLVAGVDSSTQACTIVVRDADDGRLVAQAEAAHPPASPPVSEQHPEAWWTAFQHAAQRLDLGSVAAVSIDGQGHGLVPLDTRCRVIRPAKLWNDTTASPEARELVERLGSAEWARRTGVVPVSAITVAKLLWLRRHEPASFDRLATILLPPDYLGWRLTDRFVTDRSEGSGTGYMDATTSRWDIGLLDLVDEERDWAAMLPHVNGPNEAAGQVTAAAAAATGLPEGALVGPGANDQPVCALSLGIIGEDVLISLGTSGTVSVRTRAPVSDPTGAVTGVADAAGAYRPLVCTLNATRVTDTFAGILGVDFEALAAMALAAPGDPRRPVVVPYLDGERTPDRPRATGTLARLRVGVTREQVARAAFEGVLCGLLGGLRALERVGVPGDGRVILTGGGAASPAYRQLLADLVGRPVHVSDLTETSASGAAVQAAAVLHGRPVDEIVEAWAPALRVVAEPRSDQAVDELMARYHRVVVVEELDD